MLSQRLKMTFGPSGVTGRHATEGKACLLKAQSSCRLQLWQDMMKHDTICRKNEVCLPLCGSMGAVCVSVLYLLLGWVKVFGSGLKEHFDLLTLGDVDRQLNEGLRADKT